MCSGARRDGGSYLAGARAALPFALATLVLGISFGILARSLGWGVVAPIMFSVITFSGSAQFAVAAVLGAGGGVFAAVGAAVLLNARFLPMGVAVAPYLKGGPFRRALEGQTVVDASWALARSEKSPLSVLHLYLRNAFYSESIPQGHYAIHEERETPLGSILDSPVQ